MHSFVVDSTLECKLLTGLHEDQRQKFLRASAVLRLHAYDAKEDESNYYGTLRPCGCSIPSDDECSRSGFKDDRSGEIDSVIGKKDLNAQDGAEEQDVKQEDDAVHTGVLSPRASSPSDQLILKARLEKELRPQLMMLGSWDYLDV